VGIAAVLKKAMKVKLKHNLWKDVVDLAEASKVCRDYIKEEWLGGSTWTGGTIKDDKGRFVGYVSYNGQVWDRMPSKAKPDDKPIWEPL
jgi:hypothetical protein